MANCVSDVAVRVRPLALEDSLARASELVRTAPGGAAPVQADGEIRGLIEAEEPAGWIRAFDPEVARRQTVRDLSRQPSTPIRGDATIGEALDQLRQQG